MGWASAPWLRHTGAAPRTILAYDCGVTVDKHSIFLTRMNDDTLPADKLGELGAAHRKSLDKRKVDRVTVRALLAARWGAEQMSGIRRANVAAARSHFAQSRHGGVELLNACRQSQQSESA